MDDSLQACDKRTKYLISVNFGHKLNLMLIDLETQTTECSCCSTECYEDGSNHQCYYDYGIACPYSEV